MFIMVSHKGFFVRPLPCQERQTMGGLGNEFSLAGLEPMVFYAVVLHNRRITAYGDLEHKAASCVDQKNVGHLG